MGELTLLVDVDESEPVDPLCGVHGYRVQLIGCASDLVRLDDVQGAMARRGSTRLQAGAGFHGSAGFENADRLAESSIAGHLRHAGQVRSGARK